MKKKFQYGKYFFKANKISKQIVDFLVLGVKEFRKFENQFESPNYQSSVHVKKSDNSMITGTMKLVGGRIAIFKKGEPRTPELFFRCSFLYIYPVKASSSSGESLAFDLKAEGFEIQVLTFKPQVCKAWILHLSRYCIKKKVLHYYELGDKLDKGGFATVYLGTRKRDKKKFALKLIDKRKVDTHKSWVRRKSN